MALPQGNDSRRSTRPLVAGLILLTAVALAGSAGILVGEHGLKGASLRDVFDLMKGERRDHTLLLPLPAAIRPVDGRAADDFRRDLALVKQDRWFAVDNAKAGPALATADGPPLMVDIMGFDAVTGRGRVMPADERP